MDVKEAEGLLRGLAGVFEANPGARELAASFFEHNTRTSALRDPLPKLDTRYRALVEQMPAVIFMASLEGGISEAYVSPHIEALLGYSQAEWLDDPVRWYRQIHPEDKERWSTEAAEMLTSGTQLSSVYRVLARDGRVVWLQCNAKMVRDEHGRPWFIHGLAVDITELTETQLSLERAHADLGRRAGELEAANLRLKYQMAEREAAQKNLRESEQRFRLLVDGVRDYGIFMLDADGYVVSWNQGANASKATPRTKSSANTSQSFMWKGISEEELLNKAWPSPGAKADMKPRVGGRGKMDQRFGRTCLLQRSPTPPGNSGDLPS